MSRSASTRKHLTFSQLVGSSYQIGSMHDCWTKSSNTCDIWTDPSLSHAHIYVETSNQQPKVRRNSPWPKLSPIPVTDPGHVHMPLDGLPPGVQHPDQSLVLALGSVAHKAGVGPLGLREICRRVLFICLYHCPSRLLCYTLIHIHQHRNIVIRMIKYVCICFN